MAASQGEPRDIEHLGWDDLVAHKRSLSSSLKGITEKIIEIDNKESAALASEIRDRRSQLDKFNERLRQIRSEVEKNNQELLNISEKISQSKNFLSVMESRLPSESEDVLQKLVANTQVILDKNAYRNEREKNEVLFRLKEASMKLEAIKATRVIRDQFSQLTQESARISNSISQLDFERDSLRANIAEINADLDALYDKKRKLAADRESLLLEYNGIAKKFETVNERLDSMAEMRKKQREKYGQGIPSDALFKVKEMAKKKLESGDKLSFEELKLLYEEND